ncbi:MAG: AraC family transcriptional regulator [Lachnospiraceae bacterium]|nr:AraC family transcriptional regulator [Lachnospiraceae bacterium]MBO5176779.1 AraC family transcriptional regulator [Lachnospiraceae bacterium]MBP3579545.1 AraC family transcriptional regulator [Lachnospiraceae bacterium]
MKNPLPEGYHKNSPGNFEQVPDAHFSIKRVNNQNPTRDFLHHYHDCYELYYLYSGERYYFIQDKTYHVTRGSMVLIPPNEIHRTGNLGNFGYDRMLIHFSKELFEDILSLDVSMNPYQTLEEEVHLIPLTPQEQNFVETLLHLMEQEYRSNHQKENTYIKLTLLQLLLFLNRCKPAGQDAALAEINNTQKVMFEILGYINNNYSEDLTLETISEKFFLSTYYFSRTFREVTGFHFTEYVNNVRIKEAKKLLLNSSLSVNEISGSVGFHSSTHFGRVFRQIEGCSPSAYKKKELP